MQLFEKAKELILPKYEGVPWEHGDLHVDSTAGTAITLAYRINKDAEKELVDPEMCGIAALCHDFGRVEEVRQGRESQGKKLGSTWHAGESITPTIEALKTLGITGDYFNAIIGAVAVHSDKLYTGQNIVARVLRDADKSEIFREDWGFLRMSNHTLGPETHIGGKEGFRQDLFGDVAVRENYQTPGWMSLSADLTLEALIPDYEKKGAMLKTMHFVLEWYDNLMLDIPQSYDLLREGVDHIRKKRDILRGYNDEDVAMPPGEMLKLIERSRSSDRRRATQPFHNNEYPGPQVVLNVIQPDSYVAPHRRLSDETIMWNTGRFKAIHFNDSGDPTNFYDLSKGNPVVNIPANTYQTIVSLESDSSLWMVTQGPHREPFKEDAPWEIGDKARYFNYLKKLANQ